MSNYKYKTRGKPEPRKQRSTKQPINNDYFSLEYDREPHQEPDYENISPLDPAYQNRLLEEPDYDEEYDYGDDFDDFYGEEDYY